jgi:hypothetical protein
VINLQFVGIYTNSVNINFKILLFFLILHLSANPLEAEEKDFLIFYSPLLSVSLLSFWILIAIILDSVEIISLFRIIFLDAAFTSFAKFVKPAANLKSSLNYSCIMILAIKIKFPLNQISLRRKYIYLYTLGIRFITLIRNSKSV